MKTHKIIKIIASLSVMSGIGIGTTITTISCSTNTNPVPQPTALEIIGESTIASDMGAHSSPFWIVDDLGNEIDQVYFANDEPFAGITLMHVSGNEYHINWTEFVQPDIYNFTIEVISQNGLIGSKSISLWIKPIIPVTRIPLQINSANAATYFYMSGTEITGLRIGEMGLSVSEEPMDLISKTMVANGYNDIEFSDVTIGDNAFTGCAILSDANFDITITFASNDASIGQRSFQNCVGLKGINVISENKTFALINANAFERCINLIGFKEGATDIIINDIGDYAFNDCESLTIAGISVNSINGCSGITAGFEYAYWKKTNDSFLYSAGCLATGNITIGAGGWSTFGENAFNGCASLTSIVLSDGSSISNATMFYIEDSMFKNCARLKSVTVKADIIGIGENAFENCRNLSYIEFNSWTGGQDINSLGDNAFLNCLNTGLCRIKGNAVNDLLTAAYLKWGPDNYLSNWTAL